MRGMPSLGISITLSECFSSVRKPPCKKKEKAAISIAFPIVWHSQREFDPSYKASDTEATEQYNEPDSAALSLAEQVDSVRAENKTEPQEWLCFIWHPQQESNL